jgi:hypothetical protein
MKYDKRKLRLETLEPRQLLCGYGPGDANRDCHFDDVDVVQILESGKFLTGQSARWAEGDFNGDGVFDRLDLVAALQSGSYMPRSGEPDGTDVVSGPDDVGEAGMHQNSPQLLPEHQALLRLVDLADVTHKAVSSGVWTDANVWGDGKTPSDGARVWIPANIDLTVDGIVDSRLATLRLDGSLRFDPDRDTELTVETLIGTPGCTLVMGTKDHPIDRNVTASLTITANGPIDRESDPFSLSRGFISHGTVTIHGAEKTAFVALSRLPSAGDHVFYLSDVPRGWQVGDRVVIPGVNPHSYLDDEVRTIAAIVDHIVVLDRPLESVRSLPRDDMGLALHLANLTRNAVVKSESQELQERGHVMFMHTRVVHIEFAGFYGLGRTNKLERASDAVLDEHGRLVPGSGTNQRGRYAVHFHRNGVANDGHPAAVNGSVVDGSPGWGFVSHSSYVDFTNNVAFDVDGAAFVTEAGDEIGSFVGNFAVHSEGSGEFAANREDIQDFGHEGSGFWFQGAGIAVTNNVAAGHSTNGFNYYARGLYEADLGRTSVFVTENLADPSIARSAGIYAGEIPIVEFHDNVAYGNQIGLTVRYHQLREYHDKASLMENITLWNNVTGLNIPYTRQTVFRNVTILGDVREPSSFGVRSTRATGEITFENVHIEGFEIGLRAPPRGANAIHNGYFRNVQNIVITSPTRPHRSVRISGDIEFAPLPDDSPFSQRQQDIVLAVHLWMNQEILAPVLATDTVVLDYGPFDGHQAHYPEQLPTAVPFADSYRIVPSEYVGLSSQQLWDQFGVAVGGTLAPADGIRFPRFNAIISTGKDVGLDVDPIAGTER